MYEHAAAVVALVAPDGQIAYASPATTGILGYAPNELIGDNIFTFMHADDRQNTLDLVDEIVCEPGCSASAEFRFRHKDGAWRWLDATLTNWLDTPSVHAVVVNCRDITQRKSEAQRLDLVEGQFRVLIENAVHITAILNLDRTIRYISPVVKRMLGYAPDLLRGVDVLDLIHPDDVALAKKRFAYRAQNPGVGEFVQFRLRHKDGSWRVLEAIATNRVDDPLIAGIVVDARDITERSWMAERLRLSIDALVAIHDVGRRLGSSLEQRAIVAALLEGAMGMTPLDAGAILLRNARGRLQLVETFGSQEFWDVTGKARTVRAARQHVLRTGTSRFFHPVPARHALADVRGWAFPLRVQDRVIGVLEVYSDSLTEQSVERETLTTLADQAAGALERARLYRELAERERRLEDLVGRLFLAQEEDRRHVAYNIHDGLAQLAAAAHEHLEALASGFRTRSQRRRDDLAAALDLTARTVREARGVIAGLRPTVLDDFGLAMAISLEVQALRTEGWQADYTDCLGVERLPQMVETALFRVMQEALSNVRKHAHSQRVAITLMRRGPSVHLEVRDWGRGFRPGAAQGGAGPSERVGLAGMQERIGLLRGTCAIRSRPGAGTRIIVEVPVASDQLLRRDESKLDRPHRGLRSIRNA
jgi:PAS domain S-box-containing protein